MIVRNREEALKTTCDGFYFGSESPTEQSELTRRYGPRPLLLIAEQNTDCSIGSAFCLIINDDRVRFSVNLDVLTHSGVRVNPDVLMLAGRNHMNKDFSQTPRPTFKRALRRISVISVVISMTLVWLLLSTASIFTLKQYAQKNLELTAATMGRSLEAALVFGDSAAAEETLASLGKQGQISRQSC